MQNIKKSSLLQGVFCAGIGLLTLLVATYSYVGEKPLNSAITAVCLMLGSVLLSGANVWLTKRHSWKQWTAYVTPGTFLVVATAAAYNLWDLLPGAVLEQWWFNVSISVAFASMLVSLLTAHFVFDSGELERAIRMAIPGFRFVPDHYVMGKGRWCHDQDLLLAHAPQHRTIQAFVGAGKDVVALLSAMMSTLMKERGYLSLAFNPEEGTQRLRSGKLMHSCIASASAETRFKFDFILDPENGEGIIIESVCA